MNYYKVTDIEFDFDGEDLTSDEKNDIVQETISCLWTSPTEEHLTNTISDNMGLSVKSLAYKIVQ